MSSAVEDRSPDSPVPVWHLLVSWVILLPLLFFATNGNLIPQNGDVAFRVAEPGGSSLSHRLGVAAVVLICSVLIFSRLSMIFSMCQRMKLILALPLLALLSSAWSQDPKQSIVSGTILLVFTLFALYIGGNFEPRRQFELIMLAGGVALPLSIALALFVPSIGASGLGWHGIFVQKQNSAAVATLLLITAVHWRPAGVLQRAFRAAYVVMCLLLIVMSRSRTGWALAVVALGLSASLWIMQKMRSRDALFVALLPAALFASAVYLVHRYASDVLSAIGKDPTLGERTVIWAAAWNSVAKQPLLGYGYGAFWTGLKGASLNVVLASGWVLTQAQNGYLDVWLQIGIFGVLLVLFTVAQAVYNIGRCFHSGEESAFVRWSTVVIVCTLAYNIGESSLGLLHFVWFLFLLAGIGLNQIGRGSEVAAFAVNLKRDFEPSAAVAVRET